MQETIYRKLRDLDFGMSENNKSIIGNDNINHIYPVDDIKPHDTNHGALCKCEPVAEISINSVIVIHNSFDGREFMKTGGRAH